MSSTTSYINSTTKNEKVSNVIIISYQKFLFSVHCKQREEKLDEKSLELKSLFG